MTTRLTSLFVLVVLLVAMVAVTADAGTNRLDARQIEQLRQYSFLNQRSEAMVRDGDVTSATKGGQLSLGAFDADGGSPGYIIGRTWRDYQHANNAFRMVGHNATPNVHFAHYIQTTAPGPASSEYVRYDMFNPTVAPNGNFVNGTLGIAVQQSPLVRAGGYAQLDVDESGYAIVACRERNASEPYPPYTAFAYWDVGPSGTFLPSELDTLAALPVTNNDGYTMTHPRVAYQENGGTYVTHMLVVEDPDSTLAFQPVTYWRKTGSGPTGTWTTVGAVIDSLEYSSHEIVASPATQDVAIVWTQEIPGGDGAYGGGPRFRLSDDLGASWGPVQSVYENFDSGQDDFVGWLEQNSLYDTDGYLHIVWNANEYSAADGLAGGRDPSRILHWTNRVVGPDAGGSISTVYLSNFYGYLAVCGGAGWNTFNNAKPVISQCDGKLYCIWTQYGEMISADDSILDCANQEVVESWNSINADIFMSVSLSLDGGLWDAARNLTNSQTPGCDTTTGNECDHDTYPSMPRYGMNTASFGTTYWGAVPEVFEVRDSLAPSFPDNGYYLDVQFINDLIPDNALFGMYSGADAFWSYNPIKWFRLPCVEPVVEPNIFVGQDDFIYPSDWVHAGQEYVIDSVAVENIGNTTLNVSSIAAVISEGPGGSVTVSPALLTIDAGSEDFVDVTINPSGTIDPPAGTGVRIVADIEFTSDDPDQPLVSFAINTVVTDSVQPILWNTVTTGNDIGMTAANNGNLGNVGIGGVNLDFSNATTIPRDCDTTQTVYLYDGTPVLMKSATDYSWQPFWTPARSDDYNFVPVANGVSSQTDTDHLRTETFVTTDSSIGCHKEWFAPGGDEAYVIEKWSIYSFDGGTYNDVRLGEWLDWDVPTDATTGNQGGVPLSGDYVWQQGIDDPAEDPAGCLASEDRYGSSGLCGWFFTSEWEANEDVNNTGIYGAFVLLDEDLFAEDTDSLIPDSVWSWLGKNTKSANNSEVDDQQIVLSFGEFDIVPDDTLHIYTFHASVYDGDQTDLQELVDSANAYYWTIRPTAGCCGLYTGGKPGNTDCDPDGKYNLSDITKTITRVYLDPDTPLCCEENGDVNCDTKINLTDITQIITRVYLNPSFQFCDCP